MQFFLRRIPGIGDASQTHDWYAIREWTDGPLLYSTIGCGWRHLHSCQSSCSSRWRDIPGIPISTPGRDGRLCKDGKGFGLSSVGFAELPRISLHLKLLFRCFRSLYICHPLFHFCFFLSHLIQSSRHHYTMYIQRTCVSIQEDTAIL